MSRALALVPALLLAAFAAALGDFEGAARFPSSALAAVALLSLALLGADQLDDPLRLGRIGFVAGFVAPLALVLAVFASRAISEVPRAGAVVLTLLPAFLLVPAAVARCWSGAESRRLGLFAWSATVLGVSLWALVDAAVRGAMRTAEPLGHHNLLGVFLAVTLPVATVGIAEGGAARWLALLATAVGGVALLATRSMSALVAAAVVGLLVSSRLGRARHFVAGLGLLAIGFAVPRAQAIVLGHDRSGIARATYADGAWNGWRERPWLGWGPGASPWTLSAFLAPKPGANPAGELVGEPHSTPLRVGYEIGWIGLLAVATLVGSFAWRRWRERREAVEPRLHLAGTAGFAIALAAGLGGSWLSVPALPLAMMLSAGAALSVAPARERQHPARAKRVYRALVALYAVGAVVVLTPFALAMRDAQRAAIVESPAERERLLEEASRRDPDFPLYAARLAWSASTPPHERARAAVGAALAARGVGPLWLKAGALALEADEPRLAVPALERAVALDPLSGAPPFLLFVASRGVRLDCAARAFLGDPKLAAATYFRGREKERVWALEMVLKWPGIDRGWQTTFLSQAAGAFAPASEEADLVSRVDASPGLSTSLHLFRRSPAHVELTRIRVDRGKAAKITVPAASALESSARTAFPARGCSPPPGA